MLLVLAYGCANVPRQEQVSPAAAEKAGGRDEDVTSARQPTPAPSREREPSGRPSFQEIEATHGSQMDSGPIEGGE